MSFDFSARIPDRSAWAQVRRMGPDPAHPLDANWNDNCGPESAALLMEALGYPYVPPQQWTNAEYGSGYHGGETLQSLADFIARHFTDPPATEIVSPPDVAAAIDAYAQRGWPTIGWFYCDRGANILQSWSQISHFSPAVSFLNGVLSVRNVWAWTLLQFTAAQFNAASVGTVLVIKKSMSQEAIEMMTDSERKEFTIRTWWTLYGEFPPASGPHSGESQAQYDARMKTQPDFEHTWVVVAPDRTNLFQIWTSMYGDARAVAYRAKVGQSAPIDIAALAAQVIQHLKLSAQ